MASFLQKLLRKHSGAIIPTLNKPPAQIVVPPFLNHRQPHLAGTEQSYLPVGFRPSKSEDSISTQSIPIFPSFPFGLSLNPIPSTEFVPSGEGDAVSSDSRTIWADSVKKKRKKKMNKHKYKKLRKRLRGHS
ncbi:uncharacterized protein LOC127798657 [Diospyros lotus]|uniref:uncharacterized protein LOC127798657 n=1 Tax=Diospyros lotus TaxID=55363 RepID=UPI0022523EF4|nr:uncharacterized protein LOC127798657 [Diospyros lotus]